VSGPPARRRAGAASVDPGVDHLGEGGLALPTAFWDGARGPASQQFLQVGLGVGSLSPLDLAP